VKKVVSGASMKEKTRRPQMFNQQNYFRIKPLDFDLFCGMDVDKRSISLTIVSHDGLVKSLKIPYNPVNLIHYVRRHFPEKRIAFVYEAGPTGFGLYDDLVSRGNVCIVVAPTHISRSPADRVKTNRIDSRKLAERLRGGDITGIHVPSRLYRDLRHLVHLRESIVRHQQAMKLRMKMLLLFEGLSFPGLTAKERWSPFALNRLACMEVRSEIRFKLDQYLLAHKFGSEQLKVVNKRLLQFCSDNPDLRHSTELLCTIPGIGAIVSIYLLARIGDWRYLNHSREIANLLGMVPVEDSTGDQIRRGSISKMGDAITRNKLIETAWVSIRKDPELMEFYERIKARNPAPVAARKAIVAVARKLTTRIYAVLKYQRPYIVKEVLASGADPTLSSTSGLSRVVRVRKRNP
jgi:transposase